MPSATMGGSLLTTLKKENGAAFSRPSGDRLTTHAMGRGTTTLDSSLKASAEASSLKSKFMSMSPPGRRRAACGLWMSFRQQPQPAQQGPHIGAVFLDEGLRLLGRQRHQLYRLALHDATVIGIAVHVAEIGRASCRERGWQYV